MKKFRVILTILTILSLLGIWGQSCIHRELSEEESNVVKEIIEEVVQVVTGEQEFHIPLAFVRKAAHFTEYAILGLELTGLVALYTDILKREKIKFISLFLAPAFFSLISAMIDESIQHFSGRYCSIFDVWLDFSGAVFSILILSFILIKRHNNKKNNDVPKKRKSNKICR